MKTQVANRWLSAQIREARVSEESLRLKYVNLGDFGGTDPVTNSWFLEVAGPTFDIKEDLKKMGLQWNRERKLWGLWATQYAYDRGRNRKYEKIRRLQERAYPQLKRYVAEYNKDVQERNKSQRDMATSVKDAVKNLQKSERRMEFLKKHGIAVGFDWPNRYSTDEVMVYLEGETWEIKDILKKYSFRWNGSRKRWQTPLDDWLIIESKLIQTLGKYFAEKTRQMEEEEAEQAAADAKLSEAHKKGIFAVMPRSNLLQWVKSHAADAMGPENYWGDGEIDDPLRYWVRALPKRRPEYQNDLFNSVSRSGFEGWL